VALGRGGPQVIPRPARWRLGPGDLWAHPGGSVPASVTVASVASALAQAGEPPWEPADEMPAITLPSTTRRPSAVMCLLFDEPVLGVDQAHVVLTRRSSKLRSHAHQVSFPGGRLEPAETALEAGLREAREEVGIDPSSVTVIGRLPSMRTIVNPAPITPFVGSLPRRPTLVPHEVEVERAFTVPLVELMSPVAYRQELWTFPDGREVAMPFYELIGDTVWGATARMLTDLLLLVVAFPR
jgi:8-oxo-dGTP pyrophosphatase MutT (NUDIX family)